MGVAWRAERDCGGRVSCVGEGSDGYRDCAQQQPQTCGNQFNDPKPVTEPLDYDKNGMISQAADRDVAEQNPAVSSLTQALRAFTP